MRPLRRPLSPRWPLGPTLCALLVSLLPAAEPVKPAEPPEPPSGEQFFGLPNVRQPRVSPDGKKIAFLFPHEKKMALGVFDCATKQSRMILRGEDESLSSFFWKGNDRLVFQADVSG